MLIFCQAIRQICLPSYAKQSASFGRGASTHNGIPQRIATKAHPCYTNFILQPFENSREEQTMNIIICDDDPCYLETIAGAVDRWSLERKLHKAVVTHCFASAEDLWEAWQKGLTVDLAFLDIEIPGELSGLDVAKLIRETDSQASIVFVTNYSEYACDGYSVNALRYLKKPISDRNLFECLDISYRQWDYAQESSIFLNLRKQKMVLPYKHLIYVEAKAHYLAIHCTQQEPVEIRCRLSDMLAKLPEESFVQCHRGFVVNLLYVRNVSRTMLTLAGNKQIPVGSKYAESVFEKVKQYYQGMSI